MSRRSLSNLSILFLLYLSEGLPFGFQARALPVYLRSQGVSLAVIGLAGALSAPWLLKPLWAPLVDRFGSRRLGRRRSWILPLLAAMALTTLWAAGLPSSASPALLAAALLLMNTCAATMDIAVDGLAVDLLSERELGIGNAAQVVGYKLGMLLSGGVFLWASQWFSWRALFHTMAALFAAIALLVLFWTEPGVTPARRREGLRLRHMVELLLRTLRSPGGLWLLAVVGTYKLGESIADGMFTPFLVDAGFGPAQIGAWLGTYGMAASIAGSLAGGLLATRVPLGRAVFLCAAIRLGPLAAQSLLALVEPPAAGVIAVTCAENFCGGALTTCVFALMMSRVLPEIGASHYTLLAAIEVLGKSPGALLSGVIAQHGGYPATFALATLLSAGTLLLLWHGQGPGASRAAPLV